MIFVETNNWVIFVRDYESSSNTDIGNFLWAMEELQFLLYNILPYTILIITHWFNAVGVEKEDEKVALHHDISTEQLDYDSDPDL